jgi:hypothetical protein
VIAINFSAEEAADLLTRNGMTKQDARRNSTTYGEDFVDATELLAEVRDARQSFINATDATDGLGAAALFAAKFGSLDTLLQQGGQPPDDWPLEPAGDDLTEGAGPDDVCDCGEPITMFDGRWMHIYNPELRGSDDHHAQP